MLEIDSTFCKVHQSACSALKDQAIGSSRGGKNTKIHVLINEKMQLLKIILTGGQFAFSSPSKVALLVYPIKPISRLSMTLIQNCTNNATLSRDFFSESRITVTSLLVMTNWLFVLRISFYSLLVLFTFNLPTAPSC